VKDIQLIICAFMLNYQHFLWLNNVSIKLHWVFICFICCI